MHRLLVAAACLVLAGCASGTATTAHQQHAMSAAPSTTAAATMTVQSSAAASATAFDVTVRGGAVSPASSTHEIRLGTPVRITVVSDVDDEAHVHGYDKKAELTAGQPAALEFVADQPGVFDVELHEQDLPLLRLQVS